MRERRQSRNRNRLRSALLAAAMVLGVATLAPDAQAAGLLVADGGFGGQLEIESHDVEVVINNGIAVTTVTQVFRNLEDRQVEALYTFPVPRGASVANFSMWIGGKEMVGEVVEKQRAREIYDSYKRVRRDPGLLEQVDYRAFEMRIFPIAARAEQRVQITYYQELAFDADWATYVYPLATDTRSDIDSGTQGRFSLSLQVASAVPIKELGSPSHDGDFAVALHTDEVAEASLELDGGDLSRDVVLAYRLSREVSGLDVIGSKEDGEDGFFLMTLTPGEELGKAEDFGSDFVFVLDISGSMRSNGKLGLSRRAVGSFLETLGAADRFELLVFNVSPTTLFGDLSAPTRPSLDEARRFLDGQRGSGGTFLAPAMERAYAYKDPDRPLNVVILSDGLTEQRERAELVQLVAQHPADTRVFAVGVGNDINRPLLEQITAEAGGLAAFISRGDDFTRQAQAFRRKLMRPVITDLEMQIEGGDLEMQIEGGDVYDIEPRRLPNLFHGAPVRMYGRYRTPGPVRLKLTGSLGGELFERVVDLQLPGSEADSTEVERMWAWHRIDRLKKAMDRTGRTDPATIDEIVVLGESFSIVSEYTSFLVLENDAEYQRWKIERRNANRIARDREQQQRVRERLDALRRRAATQDAVPTDLAPAAQQARQPANRPGARPGPARQSSTPPSATPPRPRRDADGVDIPFSGGGGAIDPLAAVLMVLLGGIGCWILRRTGS